MRKIIRKKRAENFRFNINFYLEKPGIIRKM